MPLIADPAVAGTVFDGLQHVWRTTDNGGPQAYLDQHCNEFTGDFTLGLRRLGSHWAEPPATCPAARRQLRGRRRRGAPTKRRRPNLSGPRPGSAGSSCPTTPTPPTRRPSTFTRLDQTAAVPASERFVSGIAIDPTDPYHAVISYCGYSAYSPAATSTR